MDTKNKALRAIKLYKMIIYQNMMIMNNRRNIRYYTTKKNLLINELMDIVEYIDNDESLEEMAKLDKLSLIMNMQEDAILKMVTFDDITIEYMK